MSKDCQTKLITVRHANGDIEFKGSISYLDLARMYDHLTHFDRALINDIGDNASAADMLLVLEMLFRRFAEMTEREKLVDGVLGQIKRLSSQNRGDNE